MFTKRQQSAVDKSLQKVLDIKNDYLNRLKHLKIILETYDVNEAKNFFQANFSHIYYIFFYSLTNQENLFKQKAHKLIKEELDPILYIFEKILTLLPELIERKWQYHSISVVLQKLISQDNSFKVRQEGIRLFIIWYQIIGDSADTYLDHLFASLVPGIVPNLPSLTVSQTALLEGTGSPTSTLHSHHASISEPFYTTSDFIYSSSLKSNFLPCEIEPIVPAHPSQCKDVTCYYLQCLMDYLVSQMSKINWKEPSEAKQKKCFEFLFEKFKTIYLTNIFPDLNYNFSIYAFNIDLPDLRSYESANPDDPLLSCKCVVILWITKFVKDENNIFVERRKSFDEIIPLPSHKLLSSQALNSSSSELSCEWRDPTPFDYEVVRSVFKSSKQNVNLIHEIFHHALIMPFTQGNTIRRVIGCYKDWILNLKTELPIIMEPVDQESFKAAAAAILKVFIINGANIFLLQVPSNEPLLLEEQIDLCKRVLNLYRFIVMKLDMNKSTWEVLLLIMLRITSLVCSQNIPLCKNNFLGGRLAPAFFQTLIVTWIKANLNVYISSNLWDHLQSTLSALTGWEELIKEWCKIIETITRVMSRYVYNINLKDLPLERLTEKKKKVQKSCKADLISKVVEPKVSPKVYESASHSIEKKKLTASASTGFSSKTNDYTSSCTLSPTHLHSHHHRHSHSPNLCFHRSLSDSSLAINKLKASKRRKPGSSFSYSIHKPDGANTDPLGRSKSLNYLCFIESLSSSQSSISHIRSSSITPSSGIEITNLKDPTWPIDASSAPLNTSSQVKSILTGGSYKGWSTESSIILWRRMFGTLGDINQIQDTRYHCHVMNCIAKVMEDFIKVRDNIGVSLDNLSTPSPPSYIPPLNFFSTWLFKTLLLPDEYKESKIIAYKLLCVIASRMTEGQLTSDFLALFYCAIHQAFFSKDLEVIFTIIRYSGCNLFLSALKGSSVLFLDYIVASEFVLSAKSSESNTAPRFEALSMIGTFLSMMEVYKNIQVLDPNSHEPKVIYHAHIKDKLLAILLFANKQEQTDIERSIILNCLGVFVFQELQAKSSNIGERLIEIINIFIAETKLNNRMIPRIACSMLNLQSKHASTLLRYYPFLAKSIIDGLIASLTSHFKMAQEKNNFKDYRNVILSIIFCLGEWCMALPIQVLKGATVIHSDQSLLLGVVRTLIKISSPSSNASLLVSQTAPSTPPIAPPVPPKRRSTVNEAEVDSNLATSNDETSKSDSANAARKLSSAKSDTYLTSCNNDLSVIQLAAKMLLQHLIYYLGHFPLPILGAARVSSFISEADDNTFLKNNDDELTSEVLNAPNVLFFIINNSSIVSIVDLGYGSPSDSLTKGQPLVRTIVRDLIGKFSWDSALISSLFNLKSDQTSSYHCDSNQISFQSSNMTVESDDKDDLCEQADPLGLLLKDLGKNILNTKNGNFNAPALTCNEHLDQLEENMIALLSNQHYQEMNFIERPVLSNVANNVAKNVACTDQSQERRSNENDAYNCFMNARQFIDQQGYFLWEKRASIELLNKNERLLRELRNLDNQKCRETHKIAVIYVADGQEDKNSILMNKAGSEAFEKFVAGLGWEVNLENHLGFRGGLQQNKSTGETTPYYSNSFYEVIFHVSTRIPAKSEDSDSIRRKLTHLGNDEVHIVWSEHSRDYRRGIIPTEFCDVLIVIYPLLHYPGYYRIFVSRKPEVPFFGPLYSGAFVHHNLLADLVRATAINASRACRLQVPCYQNYFEERAKSIETIIKYHRESKCFEDFASSIYSPQITASSSSSASSSHPSQLTMRQTSNLSQSGTSISSVSNSSNSNQSEVQNHSPSLQDASPKSRFRPASLSAIDYRPNLAK